MPRLAGDGTHYRLAVLNGAGEPTDVVFDVPSVTSILDAVLAKPALPNWYYSKALEGVEILLGKYGTKIPQDKDSLKSLLRSEKLTPIHARDTAGHRGRELHDGLEALARGYHSLLTNGLNLYLRGGNVPAYIHLGFSGRRKLSSRLSMVLPGRSILYTWTPPPKRLHLLTSRLVRVYTGRTFYSLQLINWRGKKIAGTLLSNAQWSYISTKR